MFRLTISLTIVIVNLAVTTITAPLEVKAQDVPTWSSKVATIVYSKCTPCHRSGEIAPFELNSYESVKGYSYALLGAVTGKTMPPWPPSKGHGDFLGDRSLSQADIETLTTWVQGGMPEGNPAEAPKPPTFPIGSQLGVPDLVLTMKETWTVQGNNKDVYRFFVLPTGLLQDRDVSAIEFRPGNAKVVHHVLYYQDTSGTAKNLDAKDPLPGYSGFGDPGFQSASNMLGWVPGAQMRFFPPTIGARLYKNSDVVIQVHYAPSSEQTTDLSSVNIFFQKSADVRQIQQFALSPYNLTSGSFIIPANSKRTFLTSYKIPLEISLVAIAPHMHLLGIECRAFAVTPANDTVRFIKIDHWDFHWQGSYAYTNLVRLPRNSTLYYEASYDNTVNNPKNPNSPPKLVGWGESTTDEMLLCYFFWLPYQTGDESIDMDTQPVTGLAEEIVSKSSSIKIGPNPARDEVNVSYQISSNGTYSMHIVNSSGVSVATIFNMTSMLVGPYRSTATITTLPNGVYYLTLTGNGVKESSKFVVSKN